MDARCVYPTQDTLRIGTARVKQEEEADTRITAEKEEANKIIIAEEEEAATRIIAKE